MKAMRKRQHSASASRHLGTTALLGTTMFVLIATLLQFLRSDLDWQRMPLSFYLIGEYSGWMQAAYFVLALTILGLAFGIYGALQANARSVAPLGLFIAAALALLIVVLAPTDTPQHDASLYGFVHNIAALTTFVCVTTAMLLQSSRFRSDAWWRTHFRFAFLLALVCFAAVWINIFWREWPRGLTQKIVSALIVWWLLLAAIWVRRCGLPRDGREPMM